MIRLENNIEMILRIFVDAREDLGVHRGDTTRRIDQPIPMWILTDGLEDLAHGLLDRSLIDLPASLKLRAHGGKRIEWMRRFGALGAGPGSGFAEARLQAGQPRLLRAPRGAHDIAGLFATLFPADPGTLDRVVGELLGDLGEDLGDLFLLE